ncbi:MAG: PEP-CTERM sorting domain-containing protein [Planctomycetota bacterium]|nr:PEP-CTERM sorting domain-containing protein [Planctomycetota bacterium]
MRRGMTIVVALTAIVATSRTQRAEATFIQPVAIVSNPMGEWSAAYAATNMFDGQGMSTPLSGTSTYTYTHNNGSYWHSAPCVYSTIRLDFGYEVAALNTFYLWSVVHGPYSNATYANVKDFDLDFYRGDGTTAVGPTASFSATISGVVSPGTAEVFPFSDRVDMRYVDLTVLSTQGGLNWVTIGELGFEGVAPEPATLSLLALGGLAMLWKQRKQPYTTIKAERGRLLSGSSATERMSRE